MTDVRRECEDALQDSPRPPSREAAEVERRDFLSVAAAVGMGGGLVAGYGTFGVIAARFLDAPGQPVGWQYLTTVDEMKPGDSLTYAAPNGAKVVIARQGAGTSAEDFVALSSVCPHLGCAVHWEPQNDRFFCPCHNGVFDRQGVATEGPPAKAKQRLLEFPLKVEDGLLYIQVPLVALANADRADDTGDSVKQVASGSALSPQQGDMA